MRLKIAEMQEKQAIDHFEQVTEILGSMNLLDQVVFGTDDTDEESKDAQTM